MWNVAIRLVDGNEQVAPVPDICTGRTEGRDPEPRPKSNRSTAPGLTDPPVSIGGWWSSPGPLPNALLLQRNVPAPLFRDCLSFGIFLDHQPKRGCRAGLEHRSKVIIVGVRVCRPPGPRGCKH